MIFALKRSNNPIGRQEKCMNNLSNERKKCCWTRLYTISQFNPHFRDEEHKIQGTYYFIHGRDTTVTEVVF